MKALWHSVGRFSVRLSAGALALMYLLAPAGLIFATTTSATPKPTCRITVSPTSIQVGGTVTVKWTSTNATAGAITNIGNVGPTGSINLLPSSNAVTTYYGAFTGPGGTTNCTASVAVSSGSGGGGTIDQTQTNTPAALGVPATLPSAQGSSGLVPCGYSAYDPTGNNDAASSTGCQACNLAQLIQNVMTFAIGIAIPIAAALFAYAGFLYITSAANPGNIAKAKDIFKSAFIGFIIAITAWLVINTVLHVIFSQGTFSSGNWFTIECSQGGARAVNKTINSVLSSLPITAGNTGQIPSDMGGGVNAGGYASGGASGGGGENVYSCPTGQRLTVVGAGTPDEYNICSGSDGSESAVQCNSAAGYHLAYTSDINSNSYSGECANQNNQIVDYSPATTITGNSAAGTAQWSAQLAQACQNAGLTDCRLAQAIMANESSGRQGAISGVGAAGLMQIMPDTARGLDPANLGGLSNAQITQRLVNDPAYNMQLGTQYIAQLSNQFNGDPALVAAAYNGGPRANNTSSTCSGGTWWQCPLNSGYAETRVYVPRVLSTYSALR